MSLYDYAPFQIKEELLKQIQAQEARIEKLEKQVEFLMVDSVAKSLGLRVALGEELNEEEKQKLKIAETFMQGEDNP